VVTSVALAFVRKAAREERRGMAENVDKVN
jgi:hypothetical protein